MSKSKTNRVTSRGCNRATTRISANGDGKVKVVAANPTKLFTIIAMLRRPDGATMADLVDATGWKPNSVRGAMSGAIKKRRLMKIISEAANGTRTYRIVG